MKKRKGLTLLELLLTLALISLIVVGGTNIIVLGTKTQKKTLSEFNVQSNVRIVSQKVNSIIRDSSGIFLLDKEYPSPSTDLKKYLSEGWNYLMLNEDKTKLIEWTWDGTEHKEVILVDSLDTVSYKLTYDKDSLANENRLLEFVLDVNVNGEWRTIETELEGINTLQVVDRSYGGIANTLAYRSDPRLADVAVAEAAVSFVVDKSGSMGSNLSPGKTRMAVLKDEATKMIEGLAEYDNISFSISPFAGSANNSSGDNLNQMMNLKVHKDKFIGNGSIVNNLTPNGNTNTGDGMRRGYHSIINYNLANTDKTVKNFMIILVDGETNRGTLTEKINNVHKESGWFISSKPSVTINGRVYLYHSTSGILNYTHEYRWAGQNSTTYLEKDGNIDPPTEYSNITDNTLYINGRILSSTSESKNYVNIIGELIRGYRNTRDDGIEVFVIGFSSDVTPVGLQQIANATESKYGTQGTNYKYYKADTAEALETVLNEIKFQISEALWHIGGPN